MESGREAIEMWWTSAEGDLLIRPGAGERIVSLNEFHGEYDMDWMVVMRGEKEVSRHNAKFIASIIWKE